MKSVLIRWLGPLMLALPWLWLSPTTASAQSGTSTDDTVYEDIYDDEEDYTDQRFAFGLGGGIVLPNDQGNEDGEIYYSANFRWRVFDRSRSGDRDDRDKSGAGYNDRHNRSHNRGHYPGSQGDSGIRGFIEPEVGYWKRSADDSDAEDLHVGLNLIGVVPTRSADFFVGVGFGFHQIDGSRFIRNSGGVIVAETDLSNDRLGANVHVGVELHVSESIGLFGTGRLDVLEDEPYDRQTKIWGGIRFHF